ncbi:MAG: hypothetical protein SFU20_04050 [Chitinophagaceae bacterium]|nr:hypothetical protein [Chitinophagaceae bacterium]
MNKQIKQYHELVMEEERLRLLLKSREMVLRDHHARLEKELDPLFNGINWVHRAFHFGTENPLLLSGVKRSANFLFRKIVFAGTKGWGRLFAPVLTGFLSNQFMKIIANTDWKKFFEGMGDAPQHGEPVVHPADQEPRIK